MQKTMKRCRTASRFRMFFVPQWLCSVWNGAEFWGNLSSLSHNRAWKEIQYDIKIAVHVYLIDCDCDIIFPCVFYFYHLLLFTYPSMYSLIFVCQCVGVCMCFWIPSSQYPLHSEAPIQSNNWSGDYGWCNAKRQSAGTLKERQQSTLLGY